MSTLQEIESAVLRLSDKDRLQLADRILGSLPRPPVPAEADEILAEAVRRDAELESGKTIPLSEELAFLKAYIFLLKERFGENLQIELRELDKNEHTAIVPLTLQMLFENAIKHNVISTEKPLHIEVFAENGHLVVRNNLQRKNQVMDSTGVGLQNIKDRYRILTDCEVDVIVSREYFTVILPAIENLQRA